MRNQFIRIDGFMHFGLDHFERKPLAFLLVFAVRTDETQELANCFDVEASVLEFGMHEHSDNIFSPVYTLNISVR